MRSNELSHESPNLYTVRRLPHSLFNLITCSLKLNALDSISSF